MAWARFPACIWRETALGNRVVVVKVSRFGASEALTLGRLGHPNIVPVFSVSKDPETGKSAVCMPYLGEATLGDLLNRVLACGAPPRHAVAILEAARKGAPEPPHCGLQPIAPSEALLNRASYVAGIRHLAGQLLDALAYMHAEGVCHRDLKPSNVLLTGTGVPMLLDFNLSGDDRRCQKLLGGTPPYASPEQLRVIGRPDADAAGLDGRSDLFSLGVILYELLSGQHPFAAPPAGTSLSQTKLLLLARGGPRTSDPGA